MCFKVLDLPGYDAMAISFINKNKKAYLSIVNTKDKIINLESGYETQQTYNIIQEIEPLRCKQLMCLHN